MKPNNKAHKKTKIDEPQPDEESKGFIEQQTINDNDNKIDFKNEFLYCLIMFTFYFPTEFLCKHIIDENNI